MSLPVSVPKLMSEDVVEKLFPLHNEDDLVRLRKTWVKAFNKPQPIGEISLYVIENPLRNTLYNGCLTTATSFPKRREKDLGTRLLQQLRALVFVPL